VVEGAVEVEAAVVSGASVLVGWVVAVEAGELWAVLGGDTTLVLDSLPVASPQAVSAAAKARRTSSR
jgi:hypothetical protein